MMHVVIFDLGNDWIVSGLVEAAHEDGALQIGARILASYGFSQRDVRAVECWERDGIDMTLPLFQEDARPVMPELEVETRPDSAAQRSGAAQAFPPRAAKMPRVAATKVAGSV